MTEQEEIAALIRTAAAENGHLDYLFNNAGIICSSPFEQVTLDQWRTAIDVNLWGVI